MSASNSLGEKLSGKNRESIPDLLFHAMTFIMKLMDLFSNYSGKNFKTLNLKSGQTVVDYGCGPARYIHKASSAVGKQGKVFAVDGHPIAIKKVNEKIKKYRLSNVEAVQAKGYSSAVPDCIADLIYALDMFHMIEDPKAFLAELHRIIKKDGCLVIEDGHQPREQTLKKLEESGYWQITDQCSSHVRCCPKEI